MSQCADSNPVRAERSGERVSRRWWGQASRGSRVAIALVLALAATQQTRAQAPSGDGGGGGESGAAHRSEDALDAYLEGLELTELRTDYLRKRVETAPKDQRVAIAEKLARLYVELLGKPSATLDRSKIEAKANELLKMVPEADGFELRLSLSKAIYLRAEEQMERSRMRLATEEEVTQAVAAMKSLEQQFKEIALRLNQRVDIVERKEQAGDESPEVAAELAESRRLRSLAFYYAGWSQYYTAFATGQEAAALEALKSFGWLLNAASNRPAAVDKVTPALLKYEHIARAAVGCGLAAGVRGNDVEAIRWLDLVTEAEDVPPAVKDQLFSRRMIVLAGAKRWADLERLVRLARKADRSGAGPTAEPMSVWNARLLAVLTLEADRRVGGETIDLLGRIALGDLVTRGEVAQVLDLVDRFGTSPIGERGFIVHYVRGAQAYDRAREEHRTSGGNTEEPATQAGVRNAYNSASRLLEAAMEQSDAGQFSQDRARASMMLGRARFFAGEMLGAAEAFTQSSEMFGVPGGEEALWLSIVALDHAVQGKAEGQVGADRTSVEQRRQAIALFLQTYPESDRAGRLMLMQISSGQLNPDEAIRVLGAVRRDSPMYEASRRQLAKLLYDRFREAKGADREISAIKFIQVGEEIFAVDGKLVVAPPEGPTGEGREDPQVLAARRVILVGRQLLDAMMSKGAPDAERARTIVETIEAVAAYRGVSIDGQRAELTYRRLQIALASNDHEEAQMRATAIQEMGPVAGEFADASDRLLYRKLLADWRAASAAGTADDALGRSLVSVGVRVIDRFGSDPKSLADPAKLGVASAVAGAAFSVWKLSGDEGMRDLAIKLDDRVLGVQPRATESLARMCEAAESAGNAVRAIECWNVRLGAAATGSSEWFEARFNILRLMAKVDPQRAREQIDQHIALFPDFGPPPWGDRLKELNAQIPIPNSAPSGSGGTP